MIARVREWRDEEGWGIAESDELSEGVWVHFSAVVMEGWTSLKQGQSVEIEVQDLFPHTQDGYRYRATYARPIE